MSEDETVDWEDLEADGGGGAVSTTEEATEIATSKKAAVAGGEEGRTAADLEAVFDIPVKVSAVLGKCQLQVSQLMKLGRGAVIELDRKVGEAIDVYVNNRLVARGEVVLVEDRLGVTMTEIVKGDQH